ncbi:hypothetical protein IU438_12795 [Nocardia cyriacigeorgica]|uniref:hypothetical protein n=1 Tax=Nocardia cyriacigeorgica TaxID=135487 RepID=UPI00189415A5|nr:hypothetical protein [Nocardia cyriacigeorgica]MBF6088383.1 hypothetical protein [Nocardia cyriacigeorgica]MBF6095489.1 hypothetical protein [Nocardia cyriacigeorgica]MBF6100788.1 hypothetical protein [Nocardia cyriacigeorgica]MBF6161815.1 hypothetical protein [Nocardia cyriacigeorgica]MBF6200613.1 hypothetical protein [Nocardia cyriacigeorgica]
MDRTDVRGCRRVGVDLRGMRYDTTDYSHATARRCDDGRDDAERSGDRDDAQW